MKTMRTSDRAEAWDLHRPVSHTGPYDTTEETEQKNNELVKKGGIPMESQ